MNATASHIPHTVDTQMYAQQSVPPSLLDADKPACEGTSRRDFFFCIHLQHSSEPTNQPTNQLQSSLRNLLDCQKAVCCLMTIMNSSPGDSGSRPGARNNLRDLWSQQQTPCSVTSQNFGLCVCGLCIFLWGQTALFGCNEGTPHVEVYYIWIAMTTEMLRRVVLLVYAHSLSHSLTSSASTCYAFGGSARSLTHLSHIHALMCAMQCASAYAHPHTHTHTHTHTHSSSRLCERVPSFVIAGMKTSKI